jgi:hypothetical protein
MCIKKFFSQPTEGKRQPGRFKHGVENNIRIGAKETKVGIDRV